MDPNNVPPADASSDVGAVGVPTTSPSASSVDPKTQPVVAINLNPESAQSAQPVDNAWPDTPAQNFGIVSGTVSPDETTSDEMLTVPEASSEVTVPSPHLLSEMQPSSDKPVPVVKVLSVRGVEYLMMSLALWFTAGSLIWVAISTINGIGGFQAIAFPIATMLVTAPVFALLYLRLRKGELADPALRFEPSKRRLSQITQFLAFLTLIINLISFVYVLLSAISAESEVSIMKAFLSMLAVLVIAGGILVYYWFDEHRTSGGTYSA